MRYQSIESMPKSWLYLMFFAGIVTGLIHFLQDDPILKLNGFGYFALVSITCLPIPQFKAIRRSILDILLVYTFATFCLYFIISGDSSWQNNVALVAKSCELFIIIMMIGRFISPRLKKRSTVKIPRGEVPKFDPTITTTFYGINHPSSKKKA